MLGRVRRELTKPQPRLKGERRSLHREEWGSAATSARSARGVKLGGRRLDGRRASVPDRLRGLRRTGSALSDHVRDSVHRSSPNPDRVMVRASVVWVLAFQMLCESLKLHWNQGTADVRQAG